MFEFDVSAQQVLPRGASVAGPYSLTANDSSLFWTNGVNHKVVTRPAPGALVATVWKRAGTSFPRIIRSGSSRVFFGVSASPSSGSILSFVPDSPPTGLDGSPACPPEGTGPACDFAAITVTPILECVVEKPNNQFVAHFGYTNRALATHRLGVGPKNRIDRDDGDACQPTTFVSGTHHDVFAVAFQNEVQWTIGTLTATATASSPRCAPGAVVDTEVVP